MNIVVTGATSFVGASTVKALLAQGETVYAVARPNSLALKNLPREAGLGNLHIIENDLGRMDQLPDKIGKECQVFLHFGWGGSGSDSRKDRALQKHNVDCSLAAVEAAKALGCERFLFSGSQAEYGMHQTRMDEDTPCAPLSAYGEAKLLVGKQAAKVCSEYGMDFAHTRIFSVYGPGDHPWSLVSSCMRAFTSGDQIELGDCTAKWNFLYIDDLGRAMAALVNEKKSLMASGCVYNLAGSPDETRNLKYFVEKMYELCGKKGSFQYGVRPPNAEGQVNLIPDISKMRKVTGWIPEVSFPEGITKMLQTYENVKDL